MRLSTLAMATLPLLAAALLACGPPKQQPEDLYKALLTTPLQSVSQPPGLTVRGNSAGQLDANAKAFKAIGVVNTGLVGSDQMVLWGISYTVFPSDADAKGAFDVLATDSRASPTQTMFTYPAVFVGAETVPPSVTCATLVDSVLVSGMMGSFDQRLSPSILRSYAVNLAETGVTHLRTVQNVGPPTRRAMTPVPAAPTTTPTSPPIR